MVDAYERRYRLSPCGLLTTRPEGEIVEANDTLLRWLGCEAQDLRDRTLASLLDASSRLFLDTRYNQVLLLQGHVEQVALTMLSATGEPLPILINSVLQDDGESAFVQSAIFNASERRAYEQELLRARRSAEVSERRVRILQEISAAFDVSANDQDVANTVVRVARDAFAATEVSFLLIGDDGQLRPIAGSNPMRGVVAPINAIRETDRAVFITTADARSTYPELARAMQHARFEGMSVIPLRADHRTLGLLACFFERTRELDAGFLELQESIGAQATQTLVRVRAQTDLARMALFDQLTGVPNGASIRASLDAALAHAEETRQPLTVIFLDVDDFKSVNDAFGHTTGDAVLRGLAHRLCGAVRTGDPVGRIGGDEFVAICADADAGGAATIAERILETAREAIPTGAGDIRISVSIGAAIYDPRAGVRPTTDVFLNRADDAMYSSKAAGKDRFQVG